ncbi:MAG: hypothetical protein ACK505_06135 [Flavobacteriales bacterium]|jgi:hypothetical protein
MGNIILLFSIIGAAIGIAVFVRYRFIKPALQPDNATFTGPTEIQERYNYLSDTCKAMIILSRHEDYFFVEVKFYEGQYPKPRNIEIEGKEIAKQFAKWKGISLAGINVVHPEP